MSYLSPCVVGMLDGGEDKEAPSVDSCYVDNTVLAEMGDEQSFGSAHRVNLKRNIWQALERAPGWWGQGWKGDEGRGMERYQM